MSTTSNRRSTRRSWLEKLVDDYLDKHNACVAAGHRRERILKVGDSISEHAATEEFIQAHNARAAAFRALAAARGRKIRSTI
jgi:hypothetical protein